MPHKILTKVHHDSTNTTNWTFAPVRPSYALQPKNVWRPFTLISLSLTAADAAVGYGTKQAQRLVSLDISVRDVVNYRHGADSKRDGIRVSALVGVSDREYTIALQVPDAAHAVAMARGCLGGTGYKMGPKEKALAHVAHKVGLRRDAVYFPATATATS